MKAKMMFLQRIMEDIGRDTGKDHQEEDHQEEDHQEEDHLGEVDHHSSSG